MEKNSVKVRNLSMWLFNRKNRHKDEFEMEESYFNESVEVDSDSDEEAYHQIADIISGHSERIRELLESYFDNPDLLIEELREDDEDWNDEFADLLEQAQDDYWLLLLLTLEKEAYAIQIYWRDTSKTLANKLPRLQLLKGIQLQELLACTSKESVTEYLECVSGQLHNAGIVLGTIELNDENVLVFSILERRVERLNRLMMNIEKSWKQIS